MAKLEVDLEFSKLGIFGGRVTGTLTVKGGLVTRDGWVVDAIVDGFEEAGGQGTITVEGEAICLPRG